MSFPEPVRCTGMTYADVNGVSLYYQEQGAGRPLILLHGGLHTGAMFEPVLGELAKDRRVIMPDLQAHGGTADTNRPLRFQTLADDIAALIRHLGLPQADVAGYSVGGGTALRLAIQHPGLVRRLVVVSQPCAWDGWFPEVRDGMNAMGSHMAEPFKQSPLYLAYASRAPRPEDWPVLLDKVGGLIRQPYDWSGDVGKITAPVMLVYGDADSITPAHIGMFFGLLGGGQRDGNWDGSLRPAARLAILPGQVHTTMWSAPELPGLVTSFLDADPLVPLPS